MLENRIDKKQRALVITIVFCYQRFCCKIKFAVIKKLDMEPSKARITDTFEQFFMNHTFCIFLESPRRGDSNKYPKVCFLKNKHGTVN